MAKRTWKIEGYDYVFRSGLEVEVAYQLIDWGGKWDYEAVKLPYLHPMAGTCNSCGANTVSKSRFYLPDFRVFLSSKCYFYIEVKGRLTSTDRTKMAHVKKNYPQEDIRFFFDQDRIIPKVKRRNTYGQWCEYQGFPWATGELPADWLEY